MNGGESSPSATKTMQLAVVAKFRLVTAFGVGVRYVPFVSNTSSESKHNKSVGCTHVASYARIALSLALCAVRKCHTLKNVANTSCHSDLKVEHLLGRLHDVCVHKCTTGEQRSQGRLLLCRKIDCCASQQHGTTNSLASLSLENGTSVGRISTRSP